MMGMKAEREQGVKGRKNREVRVRVNTQEVVRNTRLRLVFPVTLLSCSSRFLRALQQNRARTKFLYLLIFTYFVRQFCERFSALDSLHIQILEHHRELITSSNSWVNDDYNKHNNACNSIFLNV